jgi:hypothetical protein
LFDVAKRLEKCVNAAGRNQENVNGRKGFVRERASCAEEIPLTQRGSLLKEGIVSERNDQLGKTVFSSERLVVMTSSEIRQW